MKLNSCFHGLTKWSKKSAGAQRASRGDPWRVQILPAWQGWLSEELRAARFLWCGCPHLEHVPSVPTPNPVGQVCGQTTNGGLWKDSLKQAWCLAGFWQLPRLKQFNADAWCRGSNMQSAQRSYLRTNLQTGNRETTCFLASYHIWLFSFCVRSLQRDLRFVFQNSPAESMMADLIRKQTQLYLCRKAVCSLMILCR